MKLLCLLGMHRRKGRTVKRLGEGWVGECARCGNVITRRIEGRWRLASKRDLADLEAYRRTTPGSH